jgi:hypothetical protein
LQNICPDAGNFAGSAGLRKGRTLVDSEFPMTNATRFPASAGWLNTQHDQKATMMAAIVRIRIPPCCNQKSLSPSLTITISEISTM